MKTLAELAKLDSKDFDKEFAKARKEAMKLRFEVKTGQLAGTHKLTIAKKYVARMLTVKSAARQQEVVSKKVEKNTDEKSKAAKKRVKPKKRKK